mgnify:CR=1 FL=1
MAEDAVTTGIPELDVLIGGVIRGDNIVWEVDSGAPVGKIVSAFLSGCEAAGCPVAYVSFNRSPQTVAKDYALLMPSGRLALVDCFSSGKGNADEMFLGFFRGEEAGRHLRAVHVKNPWDPAALQEALVSLEAEVGRNARFVFDSLTGMLGLWGDEEVVLRFFSHMCPRLYEVNAVAYWLLETEAHSKGFLAKIRHVTQVVVDVAVSGGVRTVTVKKAVNRRSVDFGVPHRFDLAGSGIAIAMESREDRELRLLSKMGEVLGSALDPSGFFERTMEVLAAELGMIRGTLVVLDRTTEKLRIAAAHGLTAAERARGEYASGEGVTGRVVATGEPEVVPDVAKDPRFLDRTAARRGEVEPISFICVPLRVDEDVVGALSVDRASAAPSTLEKDLRLLTIIASMVSLVLKVNRMVQVEKEEMLARDSKLLDELKSRFRLEKVAGRSAAIQKVLAAAAVAAKSRASILITGETGTGKDLIANVVHYNSDRAEGPFVKVNCGALPETLLESELFGHVRGAFTGAVRDRKGRFELAGGGTLFLDEVGEMSPRLQVKLLRVLQEMEFEPVGSAKTVRVDVRVVAATNKDLRRGIREGWFREDLFYRLNVIPIHIPPLRERREDIPVLVDRFLDTYNRRNGRSVTKLSKEVLDLLVAYDWPGNVRELENAVERAVVMSPGDVVSRDVLPAEVLAASGKRALSRRGASSVEEAVRREVEAAAGEAEDLGALLGALTRSVEAAILRKALAAGASQRDLADRLGMSRTTLRKKLREHGLA